MRAWYWGLILSAAMATPQGGNAQPKDDFLYDPSVPYEHPDSVLEPGDRVEFEFVDTNGRPISTRQYQGHIVVVDFWTSWCPVCRTETPRLYEMSNHYNPAETDKKGLIVYRVSLDDNPAALQRELRRWHGKGKVVNVWDSNGINTIWRKRLRFLGVPYKVLLNPEGKIVEKDISLQELDLYMQQVRGERRRRKRTRRFRF